MGNITLNKASGGQLTLAPEDGTTTETVTIPSFGVGKVLQVKEAGWDSSTATTISGYTNTVLLTISLTVQANSKVVAWFCSGQTDGNGSTTNPHVTLKVDNTTFSRGDTNHWWYGVDSRAVISMQAVTGELTAGLHTFTVNCGSYNGPVLFNYQNANQGTLMLMEIAK